MTIYENNDDYVDVHWDVNDKEEYGPYSPPHDMFSAERGPLSLEQGNLSPKGLSLDTTYDKCQNANGAFCKPGDADDWWLSQDVCTELAVKGASWLALSYLDKFLLFSY